MSTLSFAVVALRLIAIYFVVSSVPLFSTAALEAAFAKKISEAPGMPQMPGFSEPAVFLAFLPAVSLLVMGLLMFVLAVPLARRLIPPASTESEKTACFFEDVQAIVFAAVGVLILTNAFPSLGRAVMVLYFWYRMPAADRVVASDRFHGDWMYSVGVIAQVIVGLIMVLSPQGCRNLWRFMRLAGTRPRSQITE